LWNKYIRLTEAEAAFRVLNSELANRPLFRRLDHRVKAHILVAFLGYALWVALKHLLQWKHCTLILARVLALLTTMQNADIILLASDGRDIRFRRITTPSRQENGALGLLGITLPERLDLNFECSVNSATG
jgi:hypothetical protein